MAISDQQITDWFKANPTADDATIASTMDQFGWNPADISRVTGTNLADVQSRYNAINPGGLGALGATTNVTTSAPAGALNTLSKNAVSWPSIIPGTTDEDGGRLTTTTTSDGTPFYLRDADEGGMYQNPNTVESYAPFTGADGKTYYNVYAPVFSSGLQWNETPITGTMTEAQFRAFQGGSTMGDALSNMANSPVGQFALGVLGPYGKAINLVNQASQGDILGAAAGAAGLGGYTDLSTGLKIANSLSNEDYLNAAIGGANLAGINNLGGVNLADAANLVNVGTALQTLNPALLQNSISGLSGGSTFGTGGSSTTTDNSPLTAEEQAQLQLNRLAKFYNMTGLTAEEYQSLEDQQADIIARLEAEVLGTNVTTNAAVNITTLATVNVAETTGTTGTTVTIPELVNRNITTVPEIVVTTQREVTTKREVTTTVPEIVITTQREVTTTVPEIVVTTQREVTTTVPEIVITTKREVTTTVPEIVITTQREVTTTVPEIVITTQREVTTTVPEIVITTGREVTTTVPEIVITTQREVTTTVPEIVITTQREVTTTVPEIVITTGREVTTTVPEIVITTGREVTTTVPEIVITTGREVTTTVPEIVITTGREVTTTVPEIVITTGREVTTTVPEIVITTKREVTTTVPEIVITTQREVTTTVPEIVITTKREVTTTVPEIVITTQREVTTTVPEIVITTQREVTTTVPEIVITTKREVTTTVPEIVITTKREVTTTVPEIVITTGREVTTTIPRVVTTGRPVTAGSGTFAGTGTNQPAAMDPSQKYKEAYEAPKILNPLLFSLAGIPLPSQTQTVSEKLLTSEDEKDTTEKDNKEDSALDLLSFFNFAEGGMVPQHPMGQPEFYSEGGAGTTYIQGRGDGTSDQIPAMVANSEYVLPADVVSALGNGSSDSGADILDQFIQSIRAHKHSNPPSELPPESKGPLEYLSNVHMKGRK